MYKCLKCRAVFDNVITLDGGVSYYSRPFGIGREFHRESDVEGCPCCQSEDFEKIEWDTEHCPYCDKPLDLSSVEDVENFQITCPHCKFDIEIVEGVLNE